ncbi:hypothetical protein LCGC14_0784070, partial [marine sediment metagenome]
MNKSLTSFKNLLRAEKIDLDSKEFAFLNHQLYALIAFEVRDLK